MSLEILSDYFSPFGSYVCNSPEEVGGCANAVVHMGEIIARAERKRGKAQLHKENKPRGMSKCFDTQ